jgi:hypothetical protein
MNEPRRKSRSRRGGQQQKRKGLDLWAATEPLPAPAPIVRAADAAAMLRSLGNPPLRGDTSGHYLAAVISRAADLATGLAAAAGALAQDDDA